MHPGQWRFWLGPITAREQALAIVTWTGWTFVGLAALLAVASVFGGLGLINIILILLLGGIGAALMGKRATLAAGSAVAVSLLQIGLVIWSSISTQMLLGAAPGPGYWVAALPWFIAFTLAWRSVRATLALRGLEVPTES